jgi:hypothetical protein
MSVLFKKSYVTPSSEQIDDVKGDTTYRIHTWKNFNSTEIQLAWDGTPGNFQRGR